MNLEPFGWAIGISDILNYRECPQRFAHGMRRHLPMREEWQLEPGEKDEPPESTNWTNAYGSAIHHAIHLVDAEGMTHSQAIDECLKLYGTYLGPADVQLLRDDLDVFERRRTLGVTLVASEVDWRVPLFVTDEGQQIYFRFKLDVLYRSMTNPGLFVHRDYKSSKWQKTAKEVHEDIQLWSYNWAIHEYLPECQRLIQVYDQLKYGEERTTKNDEQRALIKQWLVDEVKVIMADELFKPQINDFCRYCDLVVMCREPRRATRTTRAKLGLLAPMERRGGRMKVKLEFLDDALELERIIRDELPEFQRTRKHIEHLEKELKAVLEGMTLEERERLGWRLTDRRRKTITPDGMRELHALLGDTFYELVSLSQTQLEDYAGKPKKGEPLPPELEVARKWTVESISGANLVPAKSSD